MTESDKKLSPIVPVMVAALICDVAVEDPVSKKANLIGVFDRIHVLTFPAQRPMHLYVRFLDADGYYEITVRYVKVSTRQVLADASATLESKDPSNSASLLLAFPPLPILEEGTYEFQIWANGVFLGSTPLKAVRMSVGG